MSEMKRGGRDGRRFTAYTAATVLGATNGENHIETTVCYREGGINYFSGGKEPRGFELLVQAVKVEERTISFLVGQSSGCRFFLEGAPRYNARRLQQLTDQISPELAKIVDAGARQAWHEIRALLEAEGIRRVA